MPSLRRNAAPLLRQVNGKPHATEDNHEVSALPTPPASNGSKAIGTTAGFRKAAGAKEKQREEDIYADPASSSDEDADAHEEKGTAVPEKPSSKQSELASKPPSAAPTTKFLKPASTKRAASDENDDPAAPSGSDDDDDDDDDDDGMIFNSSQASQQRRKKARSGAGGGPATANIHAPPPGRVKTYGKKRILTPKDRKKGGFQVARGPVAGGSAAAAAAAAKGPTFKVAKGADMFAFGAEENPEGETGSRTVEGAADPDSPELSELSELDSGVEEVDPRTLDLPEPKEYVATTDCAICGASVPVLLRQEFEDRYNHGKALSYKWQQRFCRHHKADAARRIWSERAYPEVDWEGLDGRLKAQHGRLVDVMEGRAPSVYRERLQNLVNTKTTRSAVSAFNEAGAGKKVEDELQVKPGYYGPRGEKMMTEHILGHFAARLRELAVSDPLIAASGVAGGVSGFVQAVLVPEVAVALVQEDMKVGAKVARRLLAESLEVGELLNEEADEKVESVESEEDD
ncbi:hypothetical protein WHR41_04991 [Cladosporium halotolerans]|uniref:Restriction of telomere capping protein 4 n=1 Tax=Cladosporium halotolerans TaxID=1052096 RepID=A0AB34KLD9_9PEZI